MNPNFGKIASACVATIALVSNASAEEVRNVLGGYEIKKDGAVVAGAGWTMLPKVGEVAMAGSTDSVGVAKACGNSLTSVQVFAGRNVTLKLVSLERKRAKILADVAIGDVTGQGTYPLDGCTATGPIVKQIRTQAIFDVAEGGKLELPLEGGYSLIVGYRLDVQ